MTDNEKHLYLEVEKLHKIEVLPNVPLYLKFGCKKSEIPFTLTFKYPSSMKHVNLKVFMSHKHKWPGPRSHEQKQDKPKIMVKKVNMFQ